MCQFKYIYYIYISSIHQIYSELEAIVDKLATESQRGSNTLRKQTSRSTLYDTVIPLLILYIYVYLSRSVQ